MAHRASDRAGEAVRNASGDPRADRQSAADQKPTGLEGREDSGRLAALDERVRRLLHQAGLDRSQARMTAAAVTERARWLSGALIDERLDGPLLAPWLERAAGNEPSDVDVWTKAAVTAVVRNCDAVETLHSRGHLPGPAIVHLTSGVTPAVAALLDDLRGARAGAAGRASHEHTSHERAGTTLASGAIGGGPARSMAASFPCAWACLDAVAQAWRDGSTTVNYRVEVSQVAPLPPVDGTTAKGTTGDQAPGRVEVVSATGVTLPPGLHALLTRTLADGPGGCVTIPSFTQVGRSYRLLLGVLEAVLTHGCWLRMVNYVLGPTGGIARQPPLVPASGLDARAQLTDVPRPPRSPPTNR